MMFSQFWSIFRQISSWKGGQDTPFDPPFGSATVETSYYIIGEKSENLAKHGVDVGLKSWYRSSCSINIFHTVTENESNTQNFVI